jgi:hypothetical protein
VISNVSWHNSLVKIIIIASEFEKDVDDISAVVIERMMSPFEISVVHLKVECNDKWRGICACAIRHDVYSAMLYLQVYLSHTQHELIYERE